MKVRQLVNNKNYIEMYGQRNIKFCLRHFFNNQVFNLKEDLYTQSYGIFSCIRISSLVDG
jgi:hypothetical protein